jgi:hypothetical protein
MKILKYILGGITGAVIGGLIGWFGSCAGGG